VICFTSRCDCGTRTPSFTPPGPSTPMVTKRFAGSGSTITKALQYLTLTCPDIAYVDLPIYACLHDFPLSNHQIVFCVTSKGCLILTYNFPLTCDLLAYSAADWAGCSDTGKSMSCFCVFLGNNLVSWSSKLYPTVSRSSTKA
jgi:hypothetical protein